MNNIHTTASKGASALRSFAAAMMMCLLLGGLASAPARADFGIVSFDGSASAQDGTAVTDAGSHPFAVTTSFTFTTRPRVGTGPTTDGSVKTIRVHTPAGLIGDPGALAKCEPDQFESAGKCPNAAQVGFVHLRYLALGGLYEPTIPVYNMVPPPGVAGQFAFTFAGETVYLNASVRTGGDYGLDVNLIDISQGIALEGSELTLWGVPSDPRHDAERDCPGARPCTTGAPVKPFLSLPTSCIGPVTTTMDAATWADPSVFRTASFVSHDEDGLPVGGTDCDRVPFTPSMSANPTVTSAGAASGLTVVVTTPQNDNPTGLAEAHLRKSVVTLPAGVTVNPAAAGGLDACSPAQIDLTGPGAATCPEAAKIGTVSIDTPLVDHPLEGGIYLAKQGDNPFNSLLAMYIAADDPQTGTVIKLPGLMQPDAQTGQLTTTIDNNPQLPFEHLSLTFKGGARGVLALPKHCGTYTTHAEITSWASNRPVGLDPPMTIGGDCSQGDRFTPSLSAGLTNPQAGGQTSFALDLSRPNGQQDLGSVDVALPPGVLGRIGSVPVCAEAQAAAGTCDSASRVGMATAASGAGSSPIGLPQPGKSPTAVYLAGPYKGAPYSLSIVVPAQAGPLDLGTVVVRAALFVDPIDAHVTVKSDALPTILQGISLGLQKITVTIDRAGFMVTPTSCSPTKVTAAVHSAAGATANLDSRFQVGGCSALGLKPSLGLSLSGKGQTTDGKHPAVSAVLSQPAGQANLKKVRVALPLSLALDPDNSNSDDLCSFAEGSKPDPKCPASSVVGRATAVTPVLNAPLSGPVYFVKNERKDPKSGRSIKTTPKLVIPLTGQNGIKLTLTGASTVVDDQLVTTFDNIPDAPVSSFKLDINGGKKGILVVSGADICKSTQIAEQQVDGQNNKAADADVYIQTPSCPTKIISKTITKTSVKLKIGGLGAGKVTVTGRGIKKTTKTIAKSTVATITAKRTGKSRPGAFKVKFTKAKAAAAR